MELFGKEVSWKLPVVLAILLSPFIYNLDAIQGRIKLEIMCRKEGGVRFFGDVERNAGWQVEATIFGKDQSDSSFREPFGFGDIGFVRYRDGEGVERDARLVNPSAFGEGKFSHSTADQSVTPRYRYVVDIRRLSEDDRFTRTSRTVIEISSNRKLAERVAYGYEWARRERTLLSAPSMSTCHWAGEQVKRFYRDIYQTGRDDVRTNNR